MSPIDPLKPVPPSRPPMAPPFVEEEDRMDLDLVEQGMGLAEEEQRGAIAEIYEDAAVESDDPDAALDDVADYMDEEADPRGPELAAIHEIEIPDDDEEDEPID